jgi:MFS family permease
MASWRESRAGVLAVASLAIFIDMLLYGMVIPIQPRLLRDSGIQLNETDFYQAVLCGSYAVGMFIATPVIGIISDRMQNRKIPMLCGLLALAVSTMSFAYVRRFPLLVTARLAQGVSAAATWVVGFAMVADAFPSDGGLGYAVGLLLSCHTVGGFLGPLVGGFLGQYYGLQYPFLLCSALSTIDLIGRLAIKPRRPVHKDSTVSDLGILQIIQNRNVILTLITILIYSSSFSAIEVFIAYWLENDWGFSESKTSVLMLSFILPNIGMPVLVGWIAERVERQKVIAMGLILHGIAAPFIPLSWNMVTLIAFSVIYGVTAPIIGTPLSPHLVHVVERIGGGASHARVYALFNMTYSLGMILGPWVVGAIKKQTSFAWGMVVITVACIGYAPIFLSFTKIPKPTNPKLKPKSEPITSSSNLMAEQEDDLQSDKV